MSEVAHRVMGREEAERLTERIRHAAASFVEAKEKLTRFIGEAQEGRAWEALGFRSWTEYVSQVFSDTPLMRLTRDERRELVAELSEAGMSTRAIAPVIGADQKTVVNDRRAIQGEEISSPEPAPVVDDEPASEPRTTTFQSGGGFLARGEKIETDTETVVDLDTGDVISERSITGVDGKTYAVSARKTPPVEKRPALGPQIFNAVYDLGKKVDRLNELVADDRFPKHKNEVASTNRSDLVRAAETLNKIIAALN